MGEPVQAIRVINEKRLLLIMVGINILLSFGKEYVLVSLGSWKSQKMHGLYKETRNKVSVGIHRQTRSEELGF
jgi:hypothetical protein